MQDSALERTLDSCSADGMSIPAFIRLSASRFKLLPIASGAPLPWPLFKDINVNIALLPLLSSSLSHHMALNGLYCADVPLTNYSLIA